VNSCQNGNGYQRPNIENHLTLAVTRFPEMINKQRANGLEPSTFSLEGCKDSNVSDDDVKTYENDNCRGALHGALLLADDAQFRRLAEAWPTLPETIRRAILSLVASANE